MDPKYPEGGQWRIFLTEINIRRQHRYITWAVTVDCIRLNFHLQKSRPKITMETFQDMSNANWMLCARNLDPSFSGKSNDDTENERESRDETKVTSVVVSSEDEETTNKNRDDRMSTGKNLLFKHQQEIKV